jgi:hypothetical protein
MWMVWAKGLARGRIRVSAGLPDPILEMLVCLLTEASQTYRETVGILELESICA